MFSLIFNVLLVVSILTNHAEIMDYMIDPQSPAKKLSDLSFVVIGGMSFHGAKIATYLHNMNFNVTVIEDAATPIYGCKQLCIHL